VIETAERRLKQEEGQKPSSDFLKQKMKLVLDRYTREDRGLIQCFRHKKEGFVGSKAYHKNIVVLLSINNMGKISSLTMKEEKRRGSQLEKCLKKELLKMTLVSFEGEPIKMNYRFNLQ